MPDQAREGNEPEVLEAVIESTIFRNEENGYSVVEVRAGREKLTAVGILPALASGEQVRMPGAWAEHPQYGRQWKASGCEILKPTTLLGIERFLGSGLIRGIGPATAKLLVEEFGKSTLEILSEHPEKLTQVPGIGKKRARQLAESFLEQYAAREAMVFLQSYGVSPTLAVKISKAYGADAQRKIRENPYRLIDDIEGVGFLTADRIALSLGIPQDSEYRLRAGIKYALQEAAGGEGHTFLPRDALLERAARGLRVSGELLLNQMDALLFAREIIALDVDGGEVGRCFHEAGNVHRHLLHPVRDGEKGHDDVGGVAFLDRADEAGFGLAGDEDVRVAGGELLLDHGVERLGILHHFLDLVGRDGDDGLRLAADGVGFVAAAEGQELEVVLEFGVQEAEQEAERIGPLLVDVVAAMATATA